MIIDLQQRIVHYIGILNPTQNDKLSICPAPMTYIPLYLIELTCDLPCTTSGFLVSERGIRHGGRNKDSLSDYTHIHVQLLITFIFLPILVIATTTLSF